MCGENVESGNHVDVNLTHAAHLNIVVNQTHMATRLLDGTTLPNNKNLTMAQEYAKRPDY